MSDRVRRTAWVAVLLGSLLAAPPGRAADMDEFDSMMTRICQAALSPALSWLAEVTPFATASETTAIARAAALATEACTLGDPGQGAHEAARLARLAGRIEARAGTTPELWPQRQVNR